jgi:uncharacterized repeat protein (TIGR02543 family)
MTLMLVMLTATTAWADGFSFTHDTGWGDLNQSVKPGETIVPILFHYEGITNWSVTGLPTGLVSVNKSEDHQIIITGTVDNKVAAGAYNYTVTVWDNTNTPHSLSGAITVKEVINTSIRVTQYEKQYVWPGQAIRPIVLTFENANSINLQHSIPGNIQGVKDDNNHTYTVSGTVAADASAGTYTIIATAIGPVNNDYAFATVYVVNTSGNCGTTGHEADVTWAVTDENNDGTYETLTIAGTGNMADYANASDVPWTYFGTNLTTVIIGEGVTSIGVNAFRNCTNLATVTLLPTTPPTLGSDAFYNIGTSVTSDKKFYFHGAAYGSIPSWNVSGYTPIVIGTLTLSGGATTNTPADMTCNNTGYYYQDTQITLSHGEVPTGYVFTGYTVKDANNNDVTVTENGGVYTFTMPAGDVTVTANWKVPYIAADGTTAYCTDFTVLTSTTDLSGYASDNANTSERWFVVKDAGVNLGKFEIYGTTNIILCDGADITFTNTGSDWTIYHGGTLNIYGQDGGTGRLTATNTSYYGGIFVTALGGTSLLIPGNLNIYGGQITATGASDPGYGIEVSGTATLGWTRTTNSISANSYKGTVKIADGKAMTDDGGNIFFGDISDVSTIAGQTLTPYGITLTANQNGDDYWTSFYSGTQSYRADATVYTAAVSGDKVNLTPVEGAVIPTGNAVLLKSDASPITLQLNAAAASTLSGNELKGVDVETSQDASKTYYVLSKPEGKDFGFYKLSNTKNLGAHKAYLAVAIPPTSAPAYLGFDENTTGVGLIDNSQLTIDNWAGAIYDLQGRKIANGQKPKAKGLYIVNGRKVVIK